MKFYISNYYRNRISVFMIRAKNFIFDGELEFSSSRILKKIIPEDTNSRRREITGTSREQRSPEASRASPVGVP